MSCRKRLVVRCPSKSGVYRITCPACKTKRNLRINLHESESLREESTELLDEQTVVWPSQPEIPGSEPLAVTIKGKLVMVRHGFLKKEFPIGARSQTVGRWDESEMSDIAIKNDSSISRRSVKIDVIPSISGGEFRLTVLKCANPVLVNSTPLAAGEVISLNGGDTIILGKTKFRFEKVTQ